MRVRTALVLVASCSAIGCSSSDDASPPLDQGNLDAGSDAATDAPSDADAAPPIDPAPFEIVPESCAFTCPVASCAETTTPYACPALGDWTKIGHAAACPAWDGTQPTPQQGKCTVSAPAGEAAKYTGVDPEDATTWVLPDARRAHVDGAEWLFDEADMRPGGPTLVVPIPGSTLAAVVDAGYATHAVRLVDVSKIASGSSPMIAYEKFPVPETLTSAAVFVAPDLLLVGTADGFVRAFRVNVADKVLTRDDASSIHLPQGVNDLAKPAPYAVGGLAVTPDGRYLVVTPIFNTSTFVYDLTAPSAPVGQLSLGKGGTFAVAFDPADTEGRWAYASAWGGHAAHEIDLADRAAPKLTRSFKIDKNPQGIAFLDARWMAVANDLGDAISLVDRTTGTVHDVPVDAATTLHGKEPSNLAWDAPNHRLYATLAGADMIAAWSVDLAQTPPTLTRQGSLATSWWPSSVAVLPNGDVLATSFRGHAGGTKDVNGDEARPMQGTIQLVPAPSAADLAAADVLAQRAHDAGNLAGAPKVTCPSGVSDFPVPSTNEAGPSPLIDHVFIVLRENKTFDGVFGDLPGVAGDAQRTLKADPADMDKLWASLRDLARTFTTSDNHYTSAEVSNQGHTWATFGRSSDFTERTWFENGYSRNIWASPAQPQGTSDIGTPIEGSIFQWLVDQKVGVDIFGEAEGLPNTPSGSPGVFDLDYPGGFIQSMGHPDNEKACWVAMRARVRCDLGQVVFMTLPNDHTLGVSNGQASPEAMIAVNDEATGLLVDAISHSPFWKSSLIVITEDDPAQGGDHVNQHRVPVVLASPWVRRGYVSKMHTDPSSFYKVLANVLGKPYPNEQVATAALPLDWFTSTPDYTPYVHVPRKWPLTCGVQQTRAEQRLHDSWSFDDVDEQPGLDQQVFRALRGTPLTELPPDVEAAVARREQAREAR